MPSERNNQWWVLALPIVYFSVYSFGLGGNNILWFYVAYIIMSIMLCPIFTYIVHEAVHNSAFHKTSHNQNLLRVFDCIGGNSYIFKRRHLISHHSYSNIMGWDTDIEQSGPIRLAAHAQKKTYHRYQHIYAFFLYPLYVFNWLVVRDFKDFFYPNEEIKHLNLKTPKMEIAILILSKVWALFYLIIMPAMVYGLATALIAFIIFTMIASILALFALLPPHVNDECNFPVIKKSQIPNSWFQHQIDTTCHVEFRPRFLQYYYGFFNHHLTHHLLPNLPWYQLSKASSEMEGFFEKEKIEYKKVYLHEALIKHYKLLKKNGHALEIFDESM